MLPSSAISAPRLFFTDLLSGPDTGWNGSDERGAAVTVWGTGFGAQRDDAFVTVNGARLEQDTDYSEWGEAGPARGLERITFWVSSDAEEGPGSITVTVAGVTSNPLPFTVRDGDIYFISVNDGHNRNNGKLSSAKGGISGPWKDLFMIDPGNNKAVKPGDIIYVRSGLYDSYDEPDFIVYYRGHGGEPGKPIATVGYPGEWPTVGSTIRPFKHCSISMNISPSEEIYLDHTEWHKMLWKSGHCAIASYGSENIRIVGNRFEEAQEDAWTGVIYADNARNHEILGNYFYRNGFDKFKHDIYYNARSNITTRPDAYGTTIAWNEFRETWTDPSVRGAERGGPSVEVKNSSPNDPSTVSDVRIHDNLWVDCDDTALAVSDNFTDIYVYNNVIDHVADSPASVRAAFYAWSASTIVDPVVYLYNNTFYDSGGRRGMVRANFRARVVMKNNIFYSKDDSFTYLDHPKAEIHSENDLWYGSRPPKAVTSMKNGVAADPRFLDPAGHDFCLAAASPAIDKGSAGAAAVVTTDYHNNPRPADGDGDGKAEYDIGACERH